MTKSLKILIIFCKGNTLKMSHTNLDTLYKQVSTNAGPMSAVRYRNQFSHLNYLWLCSSVDKCLALDLKDPGLFPSQGDFFT